jgi:predicted AAA+ superfamily ATPase
MIVRDLKDNLQRKFNMGKAIVLIGPRQVGKTTLVHALLKDIPFCF